LTDEAPPAAIRAAAEARAAARRTRDWPTADRLRAEIEAAGWRVVDSGTAYRLEPAHPPEVDAGGEIRYGRSDAVPSRLGEEPTGVATAIVVAREDPEGSRRALSGLLAHVPEGLTAVLVVDGLADAAADGLAAAFAGDRRVEVIRTSAALGQAAALNVGLRRTHGRIVVVLDASIEPTGDVIGPLVSALDDPEVAISGPFGLASTDLRHFEETTAGPAAAIEGYLMAFRRVDAAALVGLQSPPGPFDEGFRFYRNLDVWWSLVLRDRGPGVPPRAARVVPGLPLVRHGHVAWSATPPAERDRLSKRNFYRVLDRFRDRLDLAVG
jgi:glycosyltransferase involved in cell wall biosynthesis